MPKKPFHLAWFVSRGYGPKAWRMPWGGPNPEQWVKPDMLVDVARALERAGFDYVMIEDSSNIPYTYQNAHDTYLRLAVDSPKLDPAVLASFMIQATKNIGIITTLSTTEYPPYLLARLTNTLDHVSEGRAGWNLVTGSNDGGAQNYGLAGQFPHDQRYDMAEEFVDAVTQLWESWDADAMVIDQEREIFADPAKVHPIHYEGEYVRTRGPLAAPRSPQGRPVICQAGGSPRGRAFAAKWAETIIASAGTVEAMKSLREDIRARAIGYGRNPDSIKILFLISPLVDEFHDSAIARRDARVVDAKTHMDWHLASFSRLTGIDLSKYHLDEPLPELTSNGHRTVAKQFEGRTPRQLVSGGSSTPGVELVGTYQHVAAQMSEIIDEVGGDGFLLMQGDLTRRYVTEIADGLVPELQRLGVVRKKYEHKMLRDNLMAY
ncbi:NtaA/DmoA family FMN-dependent monooxygenase [Acidisphaera sp. L21]|jgi:FMN-dependent oxidoreductase (nitrilotriacetate monooxygenase family)|uniref:NtaA/DmoA family FMN-dependent monooxygenase n=1 Tax=Acidisphaera sp. L21 TaxID=1641851 RepID=UPI00131D8B06|nr:NtaA/DmoA family FMN-dependent monooxygenase [Acidisphaera sp. L21]